MKRKNLVAMGLAGVMAVGMCMPVCAATDPTNVTPDTAQTGNVQIDLVQADEYTVSIPANISGKIGEDKELSFSISGAKLDPAKSLVVSSKEVSEVGVVTLGHENELGGDYNVTLKEGNQVIKGTEVLKLTAQDAATATVQDGKQLSKTINVVGDADGVKYAGKFSKTVTFDIAYK